MREPIPLVARYTLVRQWPAAALDGFAFGVLGLAIFAAKRSLGGREAVVALIITLWQVVWILTPAVGPLLARADPQRLWRTLAFAAYLPVLLIALVDVERVAETGHGTGDLPLFVVLLFVYYASSIATVPHKGALLRTNYPPHVRGRLYGLLTAVAFVTAALSAKLAGLLLDRDPRWLRVVFPAAGLAGMAGFRLYGRIRWRNRRVHRADPEPWSRVVRRAGREAWRILREDRAFRKYEIGFLLYGSGFLCSIGLLVLFAEDALGLSYDQFTWAQFVSFPAGQILAAPLWGRLSDRIGIVEQTALAFVTLALFFVSMQFVSSSAGLVAAFGLFGVAMGGVSIGWSLGPVHFAPDGQAHMYAALHFCLVGVRSVFAPWLGLLAKRAFSFDAAFALSIGFVSAGALTLWRLAVSSRS